MLRTESPPSPPLLISGVRTTYRSAPSDPSDRSDRFFMPRGGAVPSPRSGGAEAIRTPDPLRAKQVLSQLSYSPQGAVLRTEGGGGASALSTQSSALSPRSGGPSWTRTTGLSPEATARIT